ncbi:hypothetical protein [Niastella populi]|uniref:Uncharacterized protein n=1 Tax=Niastella populi TaxID=550983 RepID=A0A1V9GAH7_9BACT|nr:hypothetical protein [Niastella populi]OQP67671.1 hypothetical protein A4R26_32895 [Niastella populi]
MAKKNNPSVKPPCQRQIVAFCWNERKAGEITPVQYVNGEWIVEKSVPFGGTVEITLQKNSLIIQNRSANGNTGH